jgi:hypothetical protein
MSYTRFEYSSATDRDGAAYLSSRSIKNRSFNSGGDLFIDQIHTSYLDCEISYNIAATSGSAIIIVNSQNAVR